MVCDGVTTSPCVFQRGSACLEFLMRFADSAPICLLSPAVVVPSEVAHSCLLVQEYSNRLQASEHCCNVLPLLQYIGGTLVTLERSNVLNLFAATLLVKQTEFKSWSHITDYKTRVLSALPEALLQRGSGHRTACKPESGVVLVHQCILPRRECYTRNVLEAA